MNNILDFFYESGRVRGIRAQDFFLFERVLPVRRGHVP